MSYNLSMDVNTKGPQLVFDKTYLFMNAELDQICQDVVTVKNVGTTTVTYEWKKVQRGDYISSKKSDFVQRFYCHYPRSILKPGEQKEFIFSFKSEKVGMFNEEWELLTEPLLQSALPMVCLSGIATQEDALKPKREIFWKEYEQKFSGRDASSDNIDDLVKDIKDPLLVEPDLSDPEIFGPIFERLNRHLALYHSQETMEGFWELYDDLVLLRDRQGLTTPKWDCHVEALESYVQTIANKYTCQDLRERYIRLLYTAKKTPINRALSYGVIQDTLRKLAECTVEHAEKVRSSMDLAPPEYPWQPIPEDWTEESKAEFYRAEKAKLQEALKKAKKKPKTEEEEAKDAEDLLSRSTTAVTSQLVEQDLPEVDREVEILQTEWLMDNHHIMGADAFEKLNRKKSVIDIDIAEQAVVLRTDLDVPLTPFTPFSPLEEEFKELLEAHEAEQSADANQKKKQKKTKKQIEEEAEQWRLYEEAKRARAEPWKTRTIKDHALLNRAEASLKYLQEHMAKYVVVQSQMGKKCGRVLMENSVQTILPALQGMLQEIPLQYLPVEALSDFKSFSDELREGTIYLLENLNFKPEEHSFVEAWVEPVDKDAEPELPPFEIVPPEVLKKMPAVDRKKYEEELKKREELELAKSQPTDEEIAKAAEANAIKEQADQLRKKAEYFDSRTIYSHLKNLSGMGLVLVNDAPLACLSASSNSVSEARCAQNVLGVRLTEEIRKLAAFFTKRFPLDVKERHIKVPDPKPYLQTNFSVVLGGALESRADLLDRILLANQLACLASKIVLVGEFGIAAVSVLMAKPICKVEGATLDYLEFARFFKKFFAKAEERGCQLIFPKDFVTARWINKDDCITDTERARTASAHDEMNSSEHNKSKTNMKIPKGAKDQKEVNSPMVEEPRAHGTNSTNKEASLWAQNPGMHWTDIAMAVDKQKLIDLDENAFANGSKPGTRERTADQQPPASQIESRAGKTQYSQSSHNDLKGLSKNLKDQSNPQLTTPNTDGLHQEETYQPRVQTAGPQLSAKDHFIQYGPQTMAAIVDVINSSFKVFWDGAICLYTDTVRSSSNNRDFVNALLEMRTESEQDQEPAVTLIHGAHSEQCLRKTLLRIKIQQQEELEAQKALAAEEDGLSEPEEDMKMSESKAEVSTFQEDMDCICDFMVADCTLFTTKLLQGANIRALSALDEHRKPTVAQELEALALLEEI